MKTPALLLLSLALLASAAAAGPVDPLLEGDFDATDATESQITCRVAAEGTTFHGQGQVSGVDAHGFGSILAINVTQPTSTLRSATKIVVRQSQFADILFSSNAMTQLSGILPKCTANAVYNAPSKRVTAFFSCRGDDLSLLMDDPSIENLATTVSGLKHAKFHVDAQHKKWQLLLLCSGPVI
jgi:hypothetical protein